MNSLFRSILNYLRGNTIRRYLLVLPDLGRTKKQLKLEELRHEFALMDLHWCELSLEQKRVEHMLTDLTRCIRGLEYDLKLNSDLKRQAKRKAKQGGPKSTPDAPASDKKSPKVGDFSESKVPPRASPDKHKQQQQQQRQQRQL